MPEEHSSGIITDDNNIQILCDSSNNANKQNENKLKTKESYSNYPIPVVTLHCAVTQSISRQINTTCNGCRWVSRDNETSKMEDCVETNKSLLCKWVVSWKSENMGC